MDISAPESADVDDSCDSMSDIVKTDFVETGNYDSQMESGSESQAEFAEVGMKNSVSSGLTMKEYEEQLKKLTAENFNLKLRVYFVEERLSKVTGISDKEDLIKKNIQLKVTCESQLKELEKKQELLFEASKAFELLQKEHAEEIEKLLKEKEREITDLNEKYLKLEFELNEIKTKYPNVDNSNESGFKIKSYEEYEKQIAELESNLSSEKDRYLELENMLRDNQLELGSYELKSRRMESELEQRMRKVEELVDELEQKEHELASANFQIRKLEDNMKSKEREEEIMKDRIEEKNKTIESLKSALTSRYETIESLENRITKEKTVTSNLQSKLDGLAFQNARLKEELEILQSRLRRTTEALSPRAKGRSSEDEHFRQKYEEAVKAGEEKESLHNKRVTDLEEKIRQKNSQLEDYQDLLDKHKKLEDDHRKACTALKNFIKRSSDEKKEREVLNHMLNNHEEVIAELKAELDRYRNNLIPRLPADDKLQSTAAELEKEDVMSVFEIEKMECDKSVKKFLKLEAEILLLNQRLEVVDTENFSKENILKEIDTKKSEIKILDGEIKKRNINMQEIVAQELLNKNHQIAKLEKRLTEISEVNNAEIIMLQHEINLKDQQLNVLQNKLQEFGAISDSSALLECKLFLGVTKTESFNSVIGEGVKELSVWSMDNGDDPCRKSLGFNGAEKGDSKDSEKYKLDIAKSKKNINNLENDTAKACAMLSARLEELAVFLDALLNNGELLSEIGLKKHPDIREAMEKSRDLSKQLSRSIMRKNKSEISINWSDLESPRDMNLSETMCDSLYQIDCSKDVLSRDKIISDQTIIINRLREQLKLLNEEILQRDIELSQCQATSEKEFVDCNVEFSDQDEMEKQSIIMCQESNDDFNEDKECQKEWDKEEHGKHKSFCEKFNKNITFFSECKNENNRDTSESEAWSEPDRSVSLARMGKLEDVGLNHSQRNSKCEYSSDSSEETVNESCRVSSKKCKMVESEIRQLQSKIKTLNETNNHLRLQIDVLKNEKSSMDITSKMQKNEEANLAEKLKKTMDRLEECSITCRQMEEQLATALERASDSAVQLTKATETISNLEEEMNKLKEELNSKNVELENRSRRIAKLENKIEEMRMESELKLIKASKQREAAEKKTFEVECKLKDVENISKEVDSKVNEIERKISETKKFKRETDTQFKEAEKQIDTAEKIMEEAEKIKEEAERKSKDFQSFIDLMRKEVEDKVKEAERRIKKSEKEKEESEKQVLKLKKRLIEAEKNKAEVEAKVEEGKKTIQCMEEKLKELEVAMDQCNEDAQQKIKEIQKKADSRILDLEVKIEERDRARKAELEKKMIEAEKISKELETGFRKQLEDAEKKLMKTKESAEAVIKRIQDDAKKQEAVLRQKIAEIEMENKKERQDLIKQLDEVKLEASEFELELTKLTNEKIHLEEEIKRMLDKESALMKDNKEIKGKYENSIHQLENQLTQLTLNKSHLASRLEEIESTNIDLVSRISAIKGKETVIMEHEFTSARASSFSPAHHGSPLPSYFTDLKLCFPSEFTNKATYLRQNSAASDPGNQSLEIQSVDTFVPPRRNMNSSPDLGIDSDPGRFSSLENNQFVAFDRVGNAENSEPVEIKKLEFENAELRKRLVRTRQALEETLTQLSAANQRKKQVERAICKQLHKTHHILKKARVNFESQDGDSLE